MAEVHSQRLEFDQSIEGMFLGALQANEDRQLLALLRDAGLDLGKKLKPAYPAEDFFRWLRIAGHHFFPQLPEQVAAKKMAEAAVQRGLEATVLGRALLMMMKAIGVRRSLLRIGRAFRNGNNYLEAEVLEVGPTTLDIRFNTVMNTPGYYEGVLEAGARLLGAREVRVSTVATEGEGRTFRIEWTE